MPEPESRSLDLEAPILAAGLNAAYLLYLAKVGETDPDDFNRSLELGELRDWLNTQIAPLLANGARAGTAMQELLGLNLTDPTELTIASGAITVTQSAHLVDTEGDASSDDLTTITAAKGVGDVLILIPANDARTVVLKHGTGNIATFNGTDVSLDTDDHWAILFRVGTRWLVMNNVATGAATDHGTLSGLGDDDHTQYVLADGTRPITGLQEVLGLHLTDATELTIASGAITATQSQHTVDTEGDAASDDLDTITMAPGAGSLLFIAPAHTDRTVVLKHGTGNIATFNGADVSLTTSAHWAMLMRFGATWLVLANSAGGSTDHGALSGLGDDDHTQYVLANGTRPITGVQELLGINLTDAAELTIATGAVTATQSLHLIDTEGDASSDDLTTITAATGAGDVLVIFPMHTDRTVVLKHGTGNLVTASGSDISLDSTAKGAILFRVGSSWFVFANVVPASFDPASPGDIGTNTPGAGKFSDMIITAGDFKVDASGNITCNSYEGRGGSGVRIDYWGLGNITLPGLSGSIDWGAPKANLTSPADATLQLMPSAASPANPTFKGPDASSGNTKGGNMKVAGGTGSGTGAQGDVELEGDIVLLDAGTRIDCDAPLGLKSYTYDTTPAPSPAGQLIEISNADWDSSSPLSYPSALAKSDGSYFRYVDGNSIVGDV